MGSPYLLRLFCCRTFYHAPAPLSSFGYNIMRIFGKGAEARVLNSALRFPVILLFRSNLRRVHCSFQEIPGWAASAEYFLWGILTFLTCTHKSNASPPRSGSTGAISGRYYCVSAILFRGATTIRFRPLVTLYGSERLKLFRATHEPSPFTNAPEQSGPLTNVREWHR